MGDVFIIHTASARDFACRAASQLAGEGSSVIRREAGSLNPETVVEAAGGDAVIVIWSPDAPPVLMLDAARRALARRVLVPVSIGGGAPPQSFAHLWPIDLNGWAGDADDPRWQFVRDEIDLARRRAETSPKPRLRARPATGRAAAPRRPAKSPSADTKLLLRIIPPAAAGLAVLSAAAVRFAAPIVPHAAQAQPPALMHFEAVEPAKSAPENQVASAVTASAPPAIRESVEDIALVSVAQSSEEEAPEPEQQVVAEAPVAEVPAPDEGASAGDAAISLAAAELAPETPAGNAEDVLATSADEETLADAAPALEALPLPPPQPDDFVGVVFRDCLDCPDMAEILAGSFEMGAPESEQGSSPEERPVRTVTIEKRFALSRREITFDDWKKCVDAGGCNAYEPSDAGWGRGKHPVVNVSFEDAQNYVAWLSVKTGQPYRLPTEAEWEYAARAGRVSEPQPQAALTPMLANYEDGARAHTAPAGSFAPNAFGLYDMFGNVWEWVADCWRDSHVSLPGDGSAIAGPCEAHVLKGGAFNSSSWRLRPAHRISKGSGARESDNGFRVARDLS